MFKRKIKENTKNEKIEKIINVVKKSNEVEKKKAEERKRKKTEGKPKGYQARKFGVVTFWFIFICMFLIFFVVLLSSGSKDDTEVEYVENKATSSESVEFAKDFLYKYYNWTNIDEISSEIKDRRKELLSRYVTKDVLENVTATSELWNSQISFDNILLKKTQDVGDNRAYLIFKVVPTFTKSQKGMQSEQLQGKSQSVKKVQFVLLKVYYDKKVGDFVIYDLPSFVNYEEDSNDIVVDSETKDLRTNTDIEEKKAIQEFLTTFFDTYTNDSVEKLSYLFENQKAVYGLNQSMKFVDLKGFDVYKGKDDNERVVVAEVTLQDPETDIEFLSHYTLVIVHTKQGYLVRNMNDKQYIDKITKHEVDTETTNEK